MHPTAERVCGAQRQHTARGGVQRVVTAAQRGQMTADPPEWTTTAVDNDSRTVLVPKGLWSLDNFIHVIDDHATDCTVDPLEEGVIENLGRRYLTRENLVQCVLTVCKLGFPGSCRGSRAGGCRHHALTSTCSHPPCTHRAASAHSMITLYQVRHHKMLALHRHSIPPSNYRCRVRRMALTRLNCRRGMVAISFPNSMSMVLAVDLTTLPM